MVFLSIWVKNLIIRLVGQKVYLYDYMSDFEKSKEEFSSRERFYSSLTGRKIVDKEHEHVLNFRNKFEVKTMKYYHDLYLKCDVLWLANVFEKFRKNSWKNYGLCPSHYFNAPDLSWDAMLKMTKIELELIPDPGLYIFFEKGTRGRISFIFNRFSKANNKL